MSSPRLPRRLRLPRGLDLHGSAVGLHVRRVFGRGSRGSSGGGARRCFGRRAERRRAQRWVFPRDAFEEVTDPALLLLLRVGQQQQLLGGGYVVVHCGGKMSER